MTNSLPRGSGYNAPPLAHPEKLQVKTIPRVIAVAALLGPLSACGPQRFAVQADVDQRYLVSCPANYTWSRCYNKANELCPAGYATLSEHADYGRNELYVSCPPQDEPVTKVQSPL